MKKVAIVGYTSTRDLTPYKNEEFAIWGLNDLYKHLPRYTAWFQMHTPEEIERTHLDAPTERDNFAKQMEAFKKMECPIYMLDKVHDVPNSKKYPLDTVINEFKSCFFSERYVKYFTNSVSYMIALAILELYEEIHVYGVDMSVDSEFKEQRPSCEFWLGVAVGRGIKIHIPDQSDLLKTRFLYGYEDERKHVFMSKMDQVLKDITQKKATAETQENSWREHRLQYIGAENGIKEMIKTWE